MQDPRDNVVRFRPKPKHPPKPKAAPKRQSAPSRNPHERAINWSRAPKALVIIVLFVLAMWLFGGMADWISGIGAG